MKYNFIYSIGQKKDHFELAHDFDFYINSCSLITKLNTNIVRYELRKITWKTWHNKNFIWFFDDKNNKFSLGQLILQVKCENCGNIYYRKYQHVKEEMKRKKLYCKHCTCSFSHRTEEYKKKYKNTMLKKYGVDSPIKDPKINKKIRNTMLRRYGVEYSTQSPEIREKYYKTMLKKYGKKSISIGWKTINNVSNIEKKFIKKIINNIKKYNFKNIYSFKNKQFFISEKGKFNHNLDFFIKDIGYCLEVNGDFWHGNLEIYDKNMIHPVIKKTFFEVYNTHKKRIENIKTNKNIKFIRNIWVTQIEKDEELCLKIVLDDIERFYEI